MLRPLAAAVVLIGGLGLSGCSVWQYARLVNVHERKLYCEEADSEISMATYRSWADEAWAETGACCPESCLAGDYAWGFREGFAQFVYAGGDGEPPAMPPRPYWQTDQRTPEGATRVTSWFEGYRHGARVAREGGYREATTVRLSASLKDCDACGCPDGQCALPTATPAPAAGPTLEAPEAIPTPGEVVIPLAEPASDEDLWLPSLEESEPTTPALEPMGGRATDDGRVRTALFQIVR